jgi:hypothetical protein
MKLDEPEQHKLKLETEIASASAAASRLHPNLAEIYRKKVDSLQGARSDPETRSEAIEILRGLIERVAIGAVEDGITIELVGGRSPTWSGFRVGRRAVQMALIGVR